VKSPRPRPDRRTKNPAPVRSVHSATRGDRVFGIGRLKADKVLATPAYPLIEAAHYLNLPLSTLRAWCLGQSLRADAKTHRFEPLIRLDVSNGMDAPTP